jgi:hypothetical protein
MEDSKKKQLKFKPEHFDGSPAAGQQHHEHLSYVRLRSEGRNIRQTTLDEFFYAARGGAKYRNVH